MIIALVCLALEEHKSMLLKHALRSLPTSHETQQARSQLKPGESSPPLNTTNNNNQYNKNTRPLSSPILHPLPANSPTHQPSTMADRPQKPTPPSSPLKTTYLALYNGISTVLWGTILGRVLLVAGIHGTRYVHPAVGEFAKWTQTIALLEVVHSLFGEFSLIFRFCCVLWRRKEVLERERGEWK